MTESSRYGQSITLKCRQQDDGTWVFGYSILEIGPTRSTSVNKHHNGSFFSTRDQAEVAALEAL